MGHGWTSRLPQLATVVRVLLSEGWRVEAEGRLYHRPGVVSLDVRSGIDWFELHGERRLWRRRASICPRCSPRRSAAILRPARRRHVRSARRRTGWRALARMAAIGTPDADHVRFSSSQGALLDAWLATQPTVSVDETFARARAELARFDGVGGDDPPTTFRGVLRDYQRDALGWFDFLRRFGFGGCLADEMGLGKTVMVLAAIEARRAESASGTVANHPVARRRAALARVQLAAGGRALRAALARARLHRRRPPRRPRRASRRHDIVLTTYGTLRRDVGHLKEIAFDYAILDEAQAIKNSRDQLGQGGAAPQGATTGSRSAARRSRTTSESCGASSTS